MALTEDRLRDLAGDGRFDPHPPPVPLDLRAKGLNNTYRFFIFLELEGEFLQFRTSGYHSCLLDNPSLDATLKVLGELNFGLRLVKFGWDPSDGEIVASVDAWVCDGDLTRAQFNQMAKSFLTNIDLQYPRIDATIETGEDPGEVDSPEWVGRV